MEMNSQRVVMVRFHELSELQTAARGICAVLPRSVEAEVALTRCVQGGWIDCARLVHDTVVYLWQRQGTVMRHGQHYIPLPGLQFRRGVCVSRSAGGGAPNSAVLRLRAGGGQREEMVGRGRDACQHGWEGLSRCCAWARWRCVRTAALHDG